jgi:hypothetical protein
VLEREWRKTITSLSRNSQTEKRNDVDECAAECFWVCEYLTKLMHEAQAKKSTTPENVKKAAP